jgi:hypothetical protein
METPIALAARAVIEFKERVARQAALVERVRSAGDARLLETENLLCAMQASLNQALHRRQHEQNKWDKDGRNW